MIAHMTRMRVIAALVALTVSGCSESSCESIERCAAPADGSHADGSHADASVPDLGVCESHDDCLSDSYCADDRTCVPYGTPADRDHDEECALSSDIGVFEPSVQCAWTTPPEGDDYPSSNQVTTTPLIIDFDFDRDLATLRPSIVFVSHAPASGVTSAESVLRVIDGATCELQHNIAAWADPNNTPAVGDLDGDGRADIVALVNTHVTAFSYDAAAETFTRMWTATERVFGGSIALHDLDDDGHAEVIADRYVYGAQGHLIATLGTTAMNEIPVIADIDEDGEMEIVTPEGIFRYDATTAGLIPEAYFAGAVSSVGHSFVAVGDLGTFPLATFGGDRAEIVVAGLGEVRVETLEGTRVFAAAFSDGSSSAAGGPPTIADFDGDGRAEIGVAAREEYVVFDLDCRPDGDPAYCRTARMDGQLWAVTVRDQSSGITGSTVFDFDADGAVEVVYADECFLRIFRGTDGTVLFSHPRSSGTNTEMAIVADADGDFRSEIVVAGENWEMCPDRDPYRTAIAFRQTTGVYVLGDPLDRWAPSRPIWNQHAYAVTHVGDRGELPRSRDVRINWRTSGLNNFRQNTQSVPDPLAALDLTSRPSGAPLDCRGMMAVVHARICNRGRLPVGRGVEVAFREGAADGPEFCRATTESLIDVGRCIEIGCSGIPPEQNIDLYVVPDPDGSFRECHEQNNTSLLENVGCVRLD